MILVVFVRHRMVDPDNFFPSADGLARIDEDEKAQVFQK